MLLPIYTFTIHQHLSRGTVAAGCADRCTDSAWALIVAQVSALVPKLPLGTGGLFTELLAGLADASNVNKVWGTVAAGDADGGTKDALSYANIATSVATLLVPHAFGAYLGAVCGWNEAVGERLFRKGGQLTWTFRSRFGELCLGNFNELITTVFWPSADDNEETKGYQNVGQLHFGEEKSCSRNHKNISEEIQRSSRCFIGKVCVCKPPMKFLDKLEWRSNNR